MFSIKRIVLAIMLSCSMQGAYGSPVDQSLSVLDGQVTSFDITNANTSEVSALAGDISIQSGCYQGTCPDFDASFDMLTAQGYYYAHFLRVNHRADGCNKCGSWEVSSDGCKSFNFCGQEWSMCVDYSKKRAHRLINGQKSCFTIVQRDLGRCSCQGLPCAPFILTPSAKVACTW